MRRIVGFVDVVGFALGLVGAVSLPSSAVAETVVTISKSQQRLAVTVDGAELYRWPVSTGKHGLDTPSGTFRPIQFERKWYSRQYDWSPMPYSVFFHRGYAMHGTYETRRLGQPASHGCVRMLLVNAATLFSLLRKQGKGNSRIVITDARLLAAHVPPPEIRVPWPPFHEPEFFVPPAHDAAVITERDTIQIAVSLPAQFEPEFDVSRVAVKPTVVAALSPPVAAAQALAHVPLPPAREAAAKTEQRHDRVSPSEANSFVSVGDEASVLRGREAWLRSLDRKYGITR